MSQAYSNPDRKHEPHVLPDIEVFFMSTNDFRRADSSTWMYEYLRNQCGPKPDIAELSQQAASLKGYYYWSCFPGCLPDSDPNGPFKTKAEALADAQSNND